MLPLKIGVFMDSPKLIHNRQFQFAFYMLLTFFFLSAHSITVHFITVRFLLSHSSEAYWISSVLYVISVYVIMVFPSFNIGEFAT